MIDLTEGHPVSGDGVTPPPLHCPLERHSLSYEWICHEPRNTGSGEILHGIDRMVEGSNYNPFIKRRVLRPFTRISRKGHKYVVYRYMTLKNPKSWVMKDCHHVKWRSIAGGVKEVTLAWDNVYVGPVNVPDKTCPHYKENEVNHLFSRGVRTQKRTVFIPTTELLGTSAVLLEGVQDTDWWDPFLPPPGSQLLEDHLRELDRIAIDVMVPNLDTGFSYPVFCAELIELRGLWRSVRNIGRDVTRFISRLGKRTIKQGADKYLESIYGWIPFCSDVQTIVEKLWHLDEKIAKYLAFANERQTLHFRRGLAPPVDFKGEEWFEAGPISRKSWDGTFHGRANQTSDFSGVWDCAARNEISDYTFQATMDFEYSIPKILGLSQKMQHFYATLETFGVVLSLKDFWEMVPFSFVVDWVLGVSDWLEDIGEVNALPVEVIIYDYCRSIRYRLDRKQTLVLHQARYNGPAWNQAFGPWPGPSWDQWPADRFTPPTHDVAVETVTSYYRKAGIPVFDKSKFPDMKTPKGIFMVTGAALIAQRMFR